MDFFTNFSFVATLELGWAKGRAQGRAKTCASTTKAKAWKLCPSSKSKVQGSFMLKNIGPFLLYNGKLQLSLL